MKKPFAVVPCCIYSNEFPKRKLSNERKVNDYNDFVEYLTLKNPNINTQELDFEGRNTVLFWKPIEENN